jgi:transposase-like protein
MKCPKCEQKERQYKNGKTKAGSQRFRCANYGLSYTPEKKAQGSSKTFRQKAIKMHIDGAGLRRTGRQLGIHHQSVANWAKQQAEQLSEAPLPPVVKAAKFDEIFTFIGDKKTESTLLRL